MPRQTPHTTFVVSRHPGAVRWLQQQGYGPVLHRSHLDPTEVQAGDTVIGTLPVHLAAQVCAAGGHYYHLALELPAGLRGCELDEADMRRCGARLLRCEVTLAPDR